MKTWVYLLFCFCCLTNLSFAQGDLAEPAITGGGFFPAEVEVGKETTIKFTFINDGFAAIPPNSVELVISNADNYFTSDGTTQPTGPAATWFNWSYAFSDVWVGVNNKEIGAGEEGEISLVVQGTDVSPGAEKSSIALRVMGSPGAFTDIPTNNSSNPSLVVVAGTGGPCAGVGDSDGDGVCDDADICAGGDDAVDSDRDGTPDFCDTCDDRLVGDDCNDGDDMTVEDKIQAATCECKGIPMNPTQCDGLEVTANGNTISVTGLTGPLNEGMIQLAIGPQVFFQCSDLRTDLPDCPNVIDLPDLPNGEYQVEVKFFDMNEAFICLKVIDVTLNNACTVDSDNDGTKDCEDSCPNDPNKITLGACGCGVADTDSDGDGTPDCNDGCPNDINKIAPGDCGCGNVDEDLNNNNVPDCNETCTVGATCDDGDSCTEGDVYDNDCNCVGTLQDDDGDGVCNKFDVCPGEDDNIDTNGNGTPDGCETPTGNADPAILGSIFSPNMIDVGEMTELIFGFKNDGFSTIPNGSVELVISAADNYYSAGAGNPPTGSAAPWFDWTYGGSDIWIGVNNQEIVADAEGEIRLKVMGTAVSPSFETTSITLRVLNNPGAFEDLGENNNATPSLRVKVICSTEGGVGATCPGTDPCYTDYKIDENCNCVGTLKDRDNDGTPDCNDGCPDDPNKIAAGDCGCGIADTDSDGDGTADCKDACPNDPLKISAGTCGCGVADADSDGDGTLDCNDACPNDPNKIAAGTCGCGVADTDSDGDGTLDCNDACPNDPNKIAAGTCGCGVADTDSDGDGTLDCNDACPNDPNKIAAGVCGCGVADADSDGDGTLDCNDACPNDPNKIAAGVCGCGVADADSDGDGTLDCNDACPNDPNKIAAGTCGCGVADTDSDGDGTLDCNDACPNDPNKIAAGDCGCGVADTDSDNDGTADCKDDCLTGAACDDGNPCTINDQYDVNCDCKGTDSGLTITFKNKRNNVCAGDKKGSIEVAITGGVTPYTTTWSNGATTPNLIELGAGNYTLTVKDANGCTEVSETYTISEPTAIDVQIVSITPQNCDDNTGAIDINVTGGTAPYKYNWVAFANTEDLTGLNARDYYLVVEDAKGCKTDRIKVTVPQDCGCDNVTYGGKIGFGNCNLNPTVCSGNADLIIGNCQLPTGGSGDLQYIWLKSTTCPNRPPGSLTNDPDWEVIPNSTMAILPVGAITQTTCFIRCARRLGCEEYVGESNIVKITISGAPRTWYADRDGDGKGDPNATKMDCQKPNNYVDNPDDCDDNNPNIPAAPGTTCDDGDATTNHDEIQADGCTCKGDPIVTVCPKPTIVGGDGKIIVSGLTAPRNYVSVFKGANNRLVDACSNCPETQVFDVPAGKYRVLVIFTESGGSNSLKGCHGTFVVDVTVTGPCSDSDGDGVCDKDDVCPGGDDKADEDGDYIPDHCDPCDNRKVGQPCDDGDACTEGDVYDANCNCAGTFADDDGDGVCNNDDICNGGDDNVDTDRDGIPDYCDDCRTGAACDDGKDCTINDRFDANCNCAGTLADDDGDGICNDDDICPGGDDNIDTDGDGTPDFCDTCDDTTVGNRCDDGNDKTENDVIQADCSCAGTPVIACNLTIEILNVSNPTCRDRNDGVVAILAKNGVGPYEYKWSTGKTGTNGIAGLLAGEYTVSIMDANGCSLVKTYTLSNPAPVEVQETIVDATCDKANGSISIEVSGDASKYKYFWDGVESTKNQTNLAAGTYTFRVRDENYCHTEFTYTVGNIVTDACQPTTGTTEECDKATLTYGNGQLTISVLPADKDYRFQIQTLPTYAVLNNQSCSFGCGATRTVNLPEGEYRIRVYEKNEWTTPFCETRITMGDAPTCTDKDGDGVCAPDDCDDNNSNIGRKQTPGRSCNDGNPNTENDRIQSDGCACLGTPITTDPCADKGGDNDGDGVCAADDCDDNNSNIGRKQSPGRSCNDGNPATENDVIQSNGCTCAGTPITTDPCADKGGDNDGDGVCADDDCDDNNPNVGAYKTVGSTCNDGNANTENDRIQSDGCTCAGTPINTGEPNCDNVRAIGGNGTITVTGLTSPIEHVKVYLVGANNALTQKASCVGDCGDTWVAENLAPGNYLIYYTLRDRNWASICADGAQDLRLLVTVEGGSTASSRNSESALSINPTQLKVYPNPAREEAFIDLSDWANQSVDVVVHNHFSQVVYEKHIEQVQTAPTKIDLRTFTNGLYYIQVKAKGQRPVTRKLMVTRLY